jgi:hypothetical protein
MDAIKRLVATSSLKTSFLARVSERKPQLFLNYNDESDILMLMVAPQDTETVVHYIDHNVAVLYTPDDLEIVGLQIEDFESEFVPLYNSLKKTWRLRDTGIKRGSVWDLTLAVEEKKLKVAIEVVKAAHPILGRPADELEKVLAYAC